MSDAGDAPQPREQVSDGLWLRSAGAADVDGIVAVETAAFGAPDEPGIRAAVEEGGGPENWAVVTDADERVVSASALLDLTLEVSGVPVPAGQIEWVATYPEHQRKGLVRAQFDRHHRLAAARGHLVTLVAGIPYFYRRLGYGYGLDYPTLFIFDHETFATRRTDAGISVRPAAADDIASMLALEATRPGVGVVASRDEQFWIRRRAATIGNRWRYEQLVVAERDGEVCGWLTGKVDDEIDQRLHCKPGAAVDAAATDALVGYMLDEARARDILLVVDDSVGSPFGERLAELGTAIALYSGYYTRTPDPIALLDALRPALSDRLRASEKHASQTGTLEISLFNAGVALDYDRGTITAVRAIPGKEDPLEDFGVGVAPDWFGALVLGRWGASALAARVDDVMLGRDRSLMDTLFPKLPCDVGADL